ncbi:MAG: hypothetical protein GTO63_23160, partial [Anaerolineae bacterium]|nr:hypothetical protein [Anaerolineae bacterium]NIN97651.1 hypothetical protein [Anaerolineae bacterium]NIQ80632.1 hypothetical protein [Anaerolineae bacterium]
MIPLDMTDTEHARLSRMIDVNRLIIAMSECGREFFQYQGRVSDIWMDHNGRLWYVDCWSREKIYLHSKRTRFGGRFCGGGTLVCLVKRFKDYIWDGRKLHPLTFGPWENWPDEKGGLWGYGKDMEKV